MSHVILGKEFVLFRQLLKKPQDPSVKKYCIASDSKSLFFCKSREKVQGLSSPNERTKFSCRVLVRCQRKLHDRF